MMKRDLTSLMIAGFFTLLLNLPLQSFGFLTAATHQRGRVIQQQQQQQKQIRMTEEEKEEEENDSSLDQVTELKRELIEISKSTNRGFSATNTDRKRAKELIFALEKLNPTAEPAASYYSTDELTRRRSSSSGSSTSSNDNVVEPSISGKWNLIYTDAPDITGLDTTRNPFSTAKLGRIGQECNPPLVKNVIEWLRPDWASSLPLSGTTDSRVLQKVVTSASAKANKPNIVNLKISGLEVASPTTTSSSSSNSSDSLVSRIEKDGLIAGLISANPIDLSGPLNQIPFGQFRILYLDDQFRITLTSQNYVAVNQRCPAEDEWF